MKKYKVLNKFKNRETNEVYQIGQEVELKEERAEEIIKALKVHGIEFLEEIEVKEEDTKEEPKKGNKES